MRPTAPKPAAGDADRLTTLAALLGETVEIEAVLGEKRVPLGDLVSTGPEAFLSMLPRDRKLTLAAEGVEIGEGTAVVVDGRLALRVDRLRPIEEIAAELGGRIRDRFPCDPGTIGDDPADPPIA